jgi:hypothetical protein
VIDEALLKWRGPYTPVKERNPEATFGQKLPFTSLFSIIGLGVPPWLFLILGFNPRKPPTKAIAGQNPRRNGKKNNEDQ